MKGRIISIRPRPPAYVILSPAMSNEPKRPEPKGTIETFKIRTQPFGRLSVVAASLTTLPQEAFKPVGERKSATKPPPGRQLRD